MNFYSYFCRPIVAPMLIVDHEKAYSNFWAGQNEKVRVLHNEQKKICLYFHNGLGDKYFTTLYIHHS